MMIGLDYANMDGDQVINLKAARQAGARYVYLRRSYAYGPPNHVVMAHDDTYANEAQQVRDAGLVVGGYLFPSFNVGAPSPEDQVKNFVAAGGDVRPGGDLPPMLDIEFPGKNGLPDTGRSKGAVVALIIEFVAQMREQLGCLPSIYTSHVQMCDDNGVGLTSTVPALENCPYMPKTPYRLGAGQPPDQVVSQDPHQGRVAWDRFDYWRLPPPWEHTGWWSVQYQGDARGFPGIHQADLSRFNTLSVSTPSTDLRWSWVARVSNLPGASTNTLVSAIMTLQHDHGLVNDGVVGPATFAALAWMNR